MKEHGTTTEQAPIPRGKSDVARADVELSTRMVQLRQLLGDIAEKAQRLSCDRGHPEDERSDAEDTVWDDLRDEYTLGINKRMDALGPEYSGLLNYRNVLYIRRVVGWS